ncbi:MULTISPECIES: acetyl-CoA carboxylase carboxyltransferase subunit alpha [unclassified Minwuia]|jgi:acetyl-CoA carboxylase carboxyl transferase subunit alpha|uniref:acetyl-CoA carboxylase carboxyltransferase subunit alpha n=1 Tax=unclassified Minwuia TaxID=2618799 RepID=UPI00247AEB82|nr:MULTISPECIES: acetyl-CoA carboxylase carboxyltransferase subunit alpha [unclassified Minwuia]
MQTYLDFEKPLAELEGKVRELQHLAQTNEATDIDAEVDTLRGKASKLLADTYKTLTPWQKTQVARHPERPHTSHYIDALITDFTPLAGDRSYGDDKALIGGMGRFRGRSVMILGTEKGHSTEGRVKHNFGMARPEGYRKAQRLMRMAERFGMPILTFVDTAGAYPGVGAEERGQAEAIARSVEVCLNVKVPIIAVIIGEGGSGGAVALAVGDRVMMLEHSIYSVISPEACSSILFKTSDRAIDAAEALKLTAQDLKRLRVADQVIPEPVGGAHRDAAATMMRVGDAIADALSMFRDMADDQLLERRRDKFLTIGRMPV